MDKFANVPSMVLNSTSPEGTGQGWSNIEPCRKDSYTKMMDDMLIRRYREEEMS